MFHVRAFHFLKIQFGFIPGHCDMMGSGDGVMLLFLLLFCCVASRCLLRGFGCFAKIIRDCHRRLCRHDLLNTVTG